MTGPEHTAFPDNITVNPQKVLQLRDALVKAYDTEAGLDDLVRASKETEYLAKITTADGLDDKAREVVSEANRAGWLGKLFKQALKERSENPHIQACYKELLTIAAETPSAAELYDAWMLRTGAYFVDRLSLRQIIRASLGSAQGQRVLVLGGPSGSGKSYSMSFLQHIRDEDNVWVASIDLEEYGITGQLNLNQICWEIAKQVELATAANMEQDARWSQTFGYELIRHLEAAKKDCWIIFDSINKVLLSESISELIKRLIRFSSQNTRRLRIVLLGLKADDELMRKLRPFAIREDLGKIDSREFEEFFAKLCEHLRRTRQLTCDERSAAEAAASVIAAWNTNASEGDFEGQWNAFLDQIERLQRPATPPMIGVQ